MEVRHAGMEGARMSSPLDGLASITLVADVNTPAQYTALAGKVLLYGGTLQVGTGGHLSGIPGLLQQGATGLEFLMMADVPGPASDLGPAWAQALAAALVTINAKLDTIIGGAAQQGTLNTAVDKLNLIIGGAAQQGTLNAVGANVTAIKTKVGA